MFYKQINYIIFFFKKKMNKIENLKKNINIEHQIECMQMSVAFALPDNF